jgi:hypothetical protein
MSRRGVLFLAQKHRLEHLYNPAPASQWRPYHAARCPSPVLRCPRVTVDGRSVAHRPPCCGAGNQVPTVVCDRLNPLIDRNVAGGVMVKR